MAQRTWKDVARLVLASYINAVPLILYGVCATWLPIMQDDLIHEIGTMYKLVFRPDRAAQWAARVSMLRMLTFSIPLFMQCLVVVWWFGTPAYAYSKSATPGEVYLGFILVDVTTGTKATRIQSGVRAFLSHMCAIMAGFACYPYVQLGMSSLLGPSSASWVGPSILFKDTFKGIVYQALFCALIWMFDHFADFICRVRRMYVFPITCRCSRERSTDLIGTQRQLPMSEPSTASSDSLSN